MMPLARKYRFNIKRIVQGEFVWSCEIITASDSHMALHELELRYGGTLISWDFAMPKFLGMGGEAGAVGIPITPIIKSITT